MGIVFCTWSSSRSRAIKDNSGLIAAKRGTHILENNKIIGVLTMLKLCMSKERLAY